MWVGDVPSCLSRVNKYNTSDNFSGPFFVNVENRDEYLDIYEKLSNGSKVAGISMFCHDPDGLPQLDEIFKYILNANENIILVGLSSYLKIFGEKELKDNISALFSVTIKKKVVVLCFQLQQILSDVCFDPRKERMIYFLQEHTSPHIRLTLIPPELNIELKGNYVIGLQKMFKAIETDCADDITVVTKHRPGEFSQSLISMSAIDSHFSAVMFFEPTLKDTLQEEAGTPEQWKYLLELLHQEHNLDNVFKKVLFQNDHLEILFHKWLSYSPYERWLYFIALKVKKTNSNYINGAIAKSADIDEFVRAIFRDILVLNPVDAKFSDVYRERKDLTRALSGDLDEVHDFCKYAEIKDADKIYYLTDNTEVEKAQIIEAISKHKYLEGQIMTILRTVYPDVAKYLSVFRFNTPLLDEYFQQYKYQKITNTIRTEFLDLVNEHAEKREFNAVLPYRNEAFEKIDVSSAYLYFVDALGVEFLGFIMQKCNELKLYAKVTVCHANLPSITSLNKEFLHYFTDGDYFPVKELDDIKHKGKEDFDYRKTSYPIHIRRELEIIYSILQDAKSKLSSGNYKKIIIASDHGASRLTIINNSTYDFDVDSRGTHGGRCCAYSNDLPKIRYATEENGYYVLASYDRFKGGHPGSVETHGGATLEEVVVPIIELTQILSNIEVRFIEDIIKISYRKKAQITLFTKSELKSPILCVNGIFYEGSKLDDHKYSFLMADIKRVGIYVADVYDENNMISGSLRFKVEKEGSTVKGLLGEEN